MTRNTLAEGLKQLIMMEEVYLLTAFPASLEASGRHGTIQIFLRRVRALRTLEKLLLEFSILVMVAEKGLSGIMAALLTDAVWD